MKKSIIAVLLAGTLLSGCVISIDDEDFDYDGKHTSWSKVEENNREKIGQLSIGNSIDSVRHKMGLPDFDELLVKNSNEHRILFYRTQRTKDDGTTTKDECTPLIFVNGELAGFGQSALTSL